jgi:hypothetical protein
MIETKTISEAKERLSEFVGRLVHRGDNMTQESLIPVERIETKIFMIRGQKVMLSMHLPDLYEVEPRALIQTIKRNAERFPDDFMFQLSDEEYANLKSQIVTSR